MRRWEDAAYVSVIERLGVALVDRLEALFDLDRRSELAWLRGDPGAVGVDTVLGELDKLGKLTELGLPVSLFDGLHSRLLDRWADRFDVTPPSALADMTRPARITLAAAWVTRRRRRVIDGLVDLLIAVVHKIGARAERRVQREQLADLRRVHGKTNVLFRMAEAALEHPDGIVSEVLIFPIVGEDTLRDPGGRPRFGPCASLRATARRGRSGEVAGRGVPTGHR